MPMRLLAAEAGRAVHLSRSLDLLQRSDGFAGDLFDKPSMRALAPGDRARHDARFVYRSV